MSKKSFTRRDFIALSTTSALSATMPPALAKVANAGDATKGNTSKKYNVLFLLTDQERYIPASEMPVGYSLPAHERLAREGVEFENHQIASNVCTPSRAVIYTGQHIQNNGMFDNCDFPWTDDLSKDIDTLGDMLRREGYYTAYKGKWHLNHDFETANDLNSPERFLAEEMEEYGFSDYFGIGDIIAHTEGGYLHDDVISAMSRSWLRGKGSNLATENNPWFLAVNLVNPHDIMYYNTDLAGQTEQSSVAMMRINREPPSAIYQQNWGIKLPESRNQSLSDAGRPAAHTEFRDARGAIVGVVPNEDDRWRRLNNYYLNCIQDVDRNVGKILNELDALGLAENTIVIYTSDHGEHAGAHGLSGKGATAYKEQNNVPLIVRHPAYRGGSRCRAVTSHVDLAPTILGFAGAAAQNDLDLPGKNLETLLADPESADYDALRSGALFNYNMFAYIDAAFLNGIAQYLKAGGDPKKIGDQFKPNLGNRGAIRSVFDGRYKFSRYFSPTEHNKPLSMEQLFGLNDVELFDLTSDPFEMKNLALDRAKNAELLIAMNAKLNLLIESEVGEDIGQMLPGGADGNWVIPPDIENLRM